MHFVIKLLVFIIFWKLDTTFIFTIYIPTSRFCEERRGGRVETLPLSVPQQDGYVWDAQQVARDA